MQKCYVLDTNVLLHDPNCLSAFEDNDIIIPFTVTEELDDLKKRDGLTGYAAREVSRRLLDIMLTTEDQDGYYQTENGGRILIDQPISPDSRGWIQNGKNDNLIIQTAKHYQKKNPERPVIFVTKDINCHIKARAMGLTVQDYQNDKVTVDSVYNGWDSLELYPEEINTFYQEGYLEFGPTDKIKYPNQMIHLYTTGYNKQSALGRFDGCGKIYSTTYCNDRVYGLEAQNVEQSMLLELLMDDELPLVTVIGPAGTGKTILSLAVSLQKTLEDEAYSKVTLVRPVTAAGDDIGYLPGDENEKLRPWMGSYFDAFERLNELKTNRKSKAKRSQDKPDKSHSAEQILEELRERGAIEMKTFTYMRGRSFHQNFVIIDEAQQMTPHLVKLMLTRAGEGTKIIMIGDPSDNQIDSALVDSRSNGLVYAVERLKESSLTGHITLSKVERSPLAEMAEQYL